MKALLGDTPLFRKITASILLASVFFLSALSAIVFYSNEKLENDLLDSQTRFELENALELLAQDPQSPLPAPPARSGPDTCRAIQAGPADAAG